MPVNYPIVHHSERGVRDRIRAKFSEYNATVRAQGNAEGPQLKGERYEIVVALHLYNLGKLTHGNQIGRWVVDSIVKRKQEITIGYNTEYDFILPGATSFPNLTAGVPAANLVGPLLGEAKSYGQGLASYMKKAVGYCLNDPTLGGFCFVTPLIQATVFSNMIGNAYEILSNPENTPGICGGGAWKNRAGAHGKPSGAMIVNHFKQYLPLVARQQRQTKSVRTIVNELATHAGFIMVCLQVPNKTHEELARTIRDL
jgi:hypothetical protein